MLLSKCVVCDGKKSKFMKEEEASGLLSSLGIKTLLNKTPLLSPHFIQMFNTRYKMNDIVNRFLLAGDVFMPESHLREPGYTYRACGLFTKTKQRIQKFQKKEINNVFVKKINKACFQNDMAYGGFKIF